MGKYGKLLVVFVVVMISLSAALVYLNRDRITPNDDFFELSIGEVPEIDIANWTLTVDGLVENDLVFNYSDILAMPKTVQTCTLKCVEGPFGVAEWGGVGVDYILEQAGVQAGAVDVIFHAVDGFDSSLTVEVASAPDIILAYEMNGETLPPEQGYPIRLVATGNYGYKWVKWIDRIQVVNYDHMGFWESRGWNDDATITTFNDWGVHAVLLTIATVFCGLACISGFKVYHEDNFWSDLPPYFNRRLHRLVSKVYILMILFVFLYWTYTTYVNRGAVFYTGHGTIGLVVFVLTVIGAALGAISSRRRSKSLSQYHMTVTVLCFFILVGTVATGIWRVVGTF